jgi:hypothetical protein
MLLSLRVYDRVISGDLLSVPAPSRSNSIDDDVLDAVQESEDLLVEQRKHVTFAFACHTPDASHLDKDGFKHELVLLDGHGFVWVWWLHLYHLLSVPAPSRSSMRSRLIQLKLLGGDHRRSFRSSKTVATSASAPGDIPCAVG